MSGTTPYHERRLRVGVVPLLRGPEEGGGFTFIDLLIGEIKRHPSNHEFTIWEEQVSSNGDDNPLEQLVRDLAIDLVWFLHPGNSSPVSVPYITTVWDLQHRLQPYFPEVSSTGWTWEQRERVYRSCLPRASRIITGTKTGKNEIVAFYGVAPENVFVVPLPTAAPKPDPRSARDARTALVAKYNITNEFLFYPAQFWPHKNHVNLLLALHQVRNGAGLLLDLVLTGSDQGNLGYVKRVVESLGLSAEVHVLGFVPREDLDRLYYSAFALTYPSFFGPDNLPPLEAFARDCPVLAAGVPGVEDQLEDAALFFTPSDPADIARAILTLYRDRELRAELTRRGRALVAERTPAAYVAQICQILDDLARIRRCWGTEYPSQEH